MSEPFFPGIERIRYEGPESENALAYRFYDPERVVLGKRMQEQLRPAVCYWHSFCWPGSDVFGEGTFARPWLQGGDPLTLAERKLEVAFEFFEKLGVPYFTFHDRDLAPEGATLAESQAHLGHMLDRAELELERTGVKPLWGTANLFSHPRYAAGAATNPNPEVFAYAAAQVRDALEATHRLGGANYVLWGGREGYDTLLNTDLRRESEQLGRFMQLVVEHKHRIGFAGTILIEPKPMEPTKHQYDFDVAAVIAFLRQYDLTDDFKINIENNHATLARHTFAHEIQTAVDAGLLGSLDVNQGDPHSGWDTDEFLHNLYDAVEIMLVLLRIGGIGSGGLNFDAKLRRSSTDPEDLFIGHISSMDTLARGLIIAHEILEDSDLEARLSERYASYDDGPGAQFERGELGLGELAALADKLGEPDRRSGKQELFESIINRHIR
ncbi:MAG: xylose isomerase [Myxococcales bacterium]|nr:xylose isomerase [Myxococcales bacterium]